MRRRYIMKMKNGLKKLFAVCLALSMVLGIGVPTVANAETASNVIDVVEVNGVQEAVIGEAATDATMTVPEGANYEIDKAHSGWYDWTNDEEPWVDEGVLFQDDHKYEIKVMVRPADNYVFTEDTILKINGEEIPADDYFVNVYEQDQYVAWSKEYSFLEQIDKIEINNVPTAEIGKKATTEGIKRPEDANYEIGDTSWYDYATDEPLDEDAVFEKGNMYYLGITVIAAEGYEFTEDTVVVVDGETLTYDEYYADGENAYIRKEYSFLEQIDKIEIKEELPDAVEGQDAQAGVLEVPEGAKYSASYAWIYDDLNNPYEGKFDTGYTYMLAVVVQPAEGCEFAEDVEVTIDGEPLDTVFVTNHGYIYLIMETHDLGENTIDKIEITATEPKAGEKISVDNVKVPEDAKYKIVEAVWLDAKTGEEATGTFQEGKQYKLYVMVATDEGVYFANDTKITLNGKEFAGAKFDNNTAAMPFLAVCELGFDLTVTDNNQNNNNQNNNQNNNNTNNNTQNNSNQNTTVKPAPATGDNMSLILWIALAVIAMAGMAVVVSKKRYEV